MSDHDLDFLGFRPIVDGAVVIDLKGKPLFTLPKDLVTPFCAELDLVGRKKVPAFRIHAHLACCKL